MHIPLPPLLPLPELPALGELPELCLCFDLLLALVGVALLVLDVLVVGGLLLGLEDLVGVVDR